jgi:hypothetical protein
MIGLIETSRADGIKTVGGWQEQIFYCKLAIAKCKLQIEQRKIHPSYSSHLHTLLTLTRREQAPGLNVFFFRFHYIGGCCAGGYSLVPINYI